MIVSGSYIFTHGTNISSSCRNILIVIFVMNVSVCVKVVNCKPDKLLECVWVTCSFNVAPSFSNSKFCTITWVRLLWFVQWPCALENLVLTLLPSTRPFKIGNKWSFWFLSKSSSRQKSKVTNLAAQSVRSRSPNGKPNADWAKRWQVNLYSHIVEKLPRLLLKRYSFTSSSWKGHFSITHWSLSCCNN